MPAPQPGLKSRARWIIRTQLAAFSPGRKHTPGIHTRATGFISFTSPARDSLTAAWREARRAGSGHWGPGHLLLGLIAQDDGVAAQSLNRLGISAEQVRERGGEITARRCQPGTPPPRPADGLIPAALAEAAAHCDEHIGTRHLLLALYRADDQGPAQVLTRLGAGESEVRAAIDAILADAGPEK
jgi:ATP-dependent Clp protease ATP-binding subunit ClpA